MTILIENQPSGVFSKPIRLFYKLTYLMIYYILVIFILLWFFICKENNIPKANKTRCFLIPVFVFAWIIMGLRNNSVGVDTFHYKDYFDYFSTLSFTELLSEDIGIEIGYRFLMWTTAKFGGGYLLFKIISSGLFCFFSYLFIYDSSLRFRSNTSIVITIVFISVAYLTAFNITRQMIASIIIAYSWITFSQKYYLSTLILFLIAWSFHDSVLFATIIYIIWFLRDVKYIGWMSIIGILILQSAFYIIAEYLSSLNYYSGYLSGKSEIYQEANFARVVWVIIAIHAMIVIIYKKNFNNSANAIAIYCLIYLFINFFAEQVSYLERMGFYFYPFVCLIYPIVGLKIRNRNYRTFYFFCIVACYIIWFLLSSESEQYVYKISEGL